MKKVFSDTIQFCVIALLAFSAFAWIEVRFVMPEPIVVHYPCDSVVVDTCAVR